MDEPCASFLRPFGSEPVEARCVSTVQFYRSSMVSIWTQEQEDFQWKERAKKLDLRAQAPLSFTFVKPYRAPFPRQPHCPSELATYFHVRRWFAERARRKPETLNPPYTLNPQLALPLSRRLPEGGRGWKLPETRHSFSDRS